MRLKVAVGLSGDMTYVRHERLGELLITCLQIGRADQLIESASASLYV